MNFIWVDWLIVAFIALSAFLGMIRGCVREVLSLLIWFGAGMLSWLYSDTIARFLQPYISTPSARVILAFALIFFTTLLVGSLFTFLLTKLVRSTGFTGTDRLFGVLFGAVRGCIILVVLAFVVKLSPLTRDNWWQDSSLIPYFDKLAKAGQKLISRELVFYIKPIKPES